MSKYWTVTSFKSAVSGDALLILSMPLILIHLVSWTFSMPLSDPGLSMNAAQVNYNTWMLMRSGIGYYRAYSMSSEAFFGYPTIGNPDETPRPPGLFLLWALLPNVAWIKFLYLCFAMMGIIAAYIFCKRIIGIKIEGTLFGILCAISMMIFFERPFWFMTEQWVAAIVAVGFAFYVRNNLGTALIAFLLALTMKEMILLLILGGALAHLLLKRKDAEGNTLWIGAVILGLSFIGLQGYFAQTNFLSAMRLTHEGSLRILHGFYLEDWHLVFSWFQFPSSPILLILATASLLTLRRHQALFLAGLLFGPILLIMTDPPVLVQVTGAKWALLSVLLQYMLWPLGVFALIRIRSLTTKRNRPIREYFWNDT